MVMRNLANSLQQLAETNFARLVVDETPAIVAYIDRTQTYRFANKAYLDWFGRTIEEMMDLTMKEVIGPIYEMNLPHITGVLNGELQIFERQVIIPDGTVRHSLMTYKPHLIDGEVLGFFVHVADVTLLKKIESELRAEKEKVGAVAARELFNLQQTNAVLKRLGAIGQEITAHLTISAITDSLDVHVHGILDVDSFSIFLMNEEGSSLRPIFHREPETTPPLQSIEISQSSDYLRRCIDERRELIVDTAVAGLNTLFHSKVAMSSLMIAPLVAAEQVMGVMMIRSLKQDAYSEREKLIFRALCAYGATAFINAKAYQQLQDAQAQLVNHGKMVALGSMVAGIAHELNTPIGNCLLAASTLEMEAMDFNHLSQSNNLRRSDLNNFIGMVQRSIGMVMQGLNSAAKLVSSFKQVAADQENEEPCDFYLHELIDDIQAKLSGELQASGHQLRIDIAHDIKMHSCPEFLDRVISNLMMNAITHAFDHRAHGEMILSASVSNNGNVRITFEDNGSGIHEGNLKRIFDPFFTTKLGQGSVGLGLNISYNIVTFVLKGSITVESVEGKGSKFVIELPMTIVNKE
ncbi:MAG: PAS domain-containing protein [Undibacterium sp.]|nr:PAS domain-containing protein [Undibacterium sp.]